MTPVLERRKPSPVPAVNPVPEYAATEDLRTDYEDMKSVLQVPWMGVVTMAYAYYPAFYDALWQGLRPLCASQAFVAASASLRSFVEEGVQRLRPPPIRGRLSALGYAPRELQAIEDMVEVFSHGNFPYLLIATVTRVLLEGVELPGDSGPAERFGGRHAPEVSVPFILMERHHADSPTQKLYEDIKGTLGLPFVNTDYRALARWPSYFSLAWRDLKPHLNGPDYEGLIATVHEQAVRTAAQLPNPGGLSPAAIGEAAKRDAVGEEVLEVARLFQWLLPGLVANVAFFRGQLAEGR